MEKFLRPIRGYVQVILFPYMPVLRILSHEVSEAEHYHLMRIAAADSFFNLFVAVILLLASVFLNWNSMLFWILGIYLVADLLTIGRTACLHFHYLRTNWPKGTFSDM